MSFANEVKRWVSPTSSGGQMALLLVVSSLIAGVSRVVLEQVALRPGDVIEQFKFWQLVSTTFLVPLSPIGLIFDVIILLQTGTWLEAQWGRKKLWAFVLGANLLANFVTVLFALVSPAVSAMTFFGGFTTIGAIWIAQGLIIGPGRINWFFFPVSGYAFAVIGAAYTLLSAITGAWFAVLPQLFGIAITVAWVQGYTPANLLLRFRSRQASKDLRKRASHLSIIDGKKSDRDQYLN